jgi:hypothetical protein
MATVPVTVRLPEPTWQQLTRQALENDRTTAAEVRRAIHYYLRHSPSGPSYVIRSGYAEHGR